MIVTSIGSQHPEVFYRVISPAYADTPRSGMGAARRGGRFNRPNQEALYLARDEVTALAEYRQDNPWLPPGTICTFFVGQVQVADLSAGFHPSYWPALWADFANDWRTEWFGQKVEPPTWYMADDVESAGLDGILFPSSANSGGTNLVLYRSSSRPITQLDVYDPLGVLKASDAGSSDTGLS